MVDPDSSIGIWPGRKHANMIDDFDDFFSRGAGSYSRNQEILESMRMRLAVEKVFNEFDVEAAEPAKRHMVTQALRDYLTDEFSD